MPSAELSQYLQARADGAGMMSACVRSGISLAEARLIEADISKGELALPEPSKEEKTMPKHDQVAEVVTPDFEKIKRIFLQDIRPAAEKSAHHRGDVGNAYKAIERECHGDRAGAKLAFKLYEMTEEARDSFLRTQYGLMEVLGIGISQDLVDKMGGQGAPTMPTVDSNGLGTDSLATLETAH